MRIYRGDIGIDMDLEEFLEILEDDYADDVFELILGLGMMEEMEGIMGPEVEVFGAEGQYSEADLQAYIKELEAEGYEVEAISMNADEFKETFGIDIEDITGGGQVVNTKKSAEDIHVERIARKYAHIDDASY